MKNKLQLLLLALAILSSQFGKAQLWVEMMHDPNANFYETVEAFNQYWANKPYERGKGYKQFRRWEAHTAPRVYPSGDVKLTSLAYSNYKQWEMEQLAAGIPKSTNGNWSLLGPVGVSAGGGAGRINFIRFDPTNSNTIWIGAPNGGLWKTTNGGTSWATTTDQLDVIGCSDIAIDPSNTQTMYLATGDGDAGDSYSIGVLKSTDGGATWNTTGLTWTVNQGRTISRLLINPSNPLIVMAFASNGTWRTTNGGTSWTQVNTASAKDAEFKPGDPNTVYAAGTTFRKSTDGGATWSTVSTGLTGIGRLAIAVSPANTAYVYVLAAKSSDNGYLATVRSTDSGASFTTRSTTPNILGWDNGADAGGQGWYDLSIAVSPTNANEVMIGGINMWKSTDGASNWTLNSHWYGGYSKPYVHADIHDIVYLPGSGTTIFSGNDGGITKTTNGGSSWTSISGNIAVAQQYRIGLSTSNASLLIAGHQDNGTNRMNGTTWSEIYGGDGMDCFIDRTNNNIMVGSYVYGEFYRSTNGGTSFTSINTGLPAGTLWLSVIHQDPVTSTTYYAGGRTALYRTTNSGTSWSALGSPTGSGAIIEFAIAPSNNQIIYALKTGANGVSKSTNGGTSFTSVSTGLPTTVAPTYIAVSNTDPNVAFVTYSGYGATSKVFKTTNGGTSWTNISTGLPNIPVNCVVYHNGSTADAIYIGTDFGVYYRDNTTSGWIEFNVGLPNTEVSDLEIYYPTGRLRAATFGRGTWDSDLYSATPAAPVANFTGTPTTICIGQTVQYTSTSSGFPDTYSWSFPGGTPSTSTAQNPVVTYNTAGTYNASLTVSNAFGNNTLTQTNYITVLSGNGSALPLSEGFVSATFPPTGWSIVNADGSTTWDRSTAAGNTPTTGNSMIFDNYNVDDSGNQDEVRTVRLDLSTTTSNQMTFDVAYAPYDATYFDGLEVLVSSDCGTTFTSVYNKSNTVLATAPATTAAFTPTAAQWRNESVSLSAYDGMTNVIVAFRNLAGYGNRIFVDNINITGTAAAPLPVASFTGSPTTVCAGSSVAFTNTSTNATSYAWTFTGGTPATSTATNPTVVYNTPGVYAVSLVATNATGSDTETLTGYITVTSAPSAPGTISGTATVCSGSTGLTYSIAAVSGATSYTWTVPSGSTITAGQGTTSITVTAGMTSGTVSVTATNSCGTSAASNFTLTVNSAPATPGVISGTTSVCSGATGQTFSIAAVSGATSYTWTVPAGATITSGQGTTSVTVSMGSSSGNVSVIPTNACGTSSASTLAITVNSAPTTPGTIAGTATVCSNSTGNTYSITAVPGASSYTWTVPVGSTITAGQGTTSITVTAGVTSGNITVTATNSCGTSLASNLAITVNSVPSTPGSITGNASACAGATGLVYTISAVPGASSYTWTVPAGSTITAGQGTTSITVTSGSTSGNITVTATNSCGTSAASSFSYTANAIPTTPGSITGTSTVCPNSTGITYSIASVPGASSYTWTVPAGATITAGQGTTNITVSFGTSSGNIGVTATNSCGTSSASTLSITVSSTLSTPGTIAGSASVCPNTTGMTYSVAAVSGATSYTWTVPAGATITSGQGTNSIVVNYSTSGGTISVTASNSCGTSSASNLTISMQSVPGTPGSITGATTVCSGSTGQTYSIASVSGASSYTWSVPAGATITAGQGTTAITVSFGGTSGNISVTASNTCGTSTSSSVAVTVNSIPATPGSITGLATVCAGTSGVTYSIASVSGATSYTWSVPTGTTITAGQGTNSITVTTGSTNGNISVTAINTCGTSSASTLALTINSTPATPGAIVGSNSVCPNSTGNSYSISPVMGATSYNWSVPVGASITSGAGTSSIVVSFGTSGGSISVNAQNSCGTSSASSLTISLSASAPAAPVVINGSASVCVGDAINYSIDPVNGATSYTWSVPGGSTIAAGQGSTGITVNFGSTSGDITVFASSSCGTSPTTVKAITINSIPTSPTVTAANNCGSSVLSASGSNLMWSTGESTASISVTSSGNYTVTQTINGCTSTAATIAASPLNVPSSPTVTAADGCGSSVLTASGSNLLWSTGETSANITVTGSGNYTVTQTVSGCQSAPSTVSANPVTVPSSPATSVANNCGSSVLSATGSNLLWSTGETTATINVSASGNYTVTQTVNGCTSSAATITASPLNIPSSPVVTAADGCGSSVLTASGSNLLWSTGETTATITVTNTGDYTVTQTVAGCESAPSTITANPSAVPSAPTVSVFNDCNGSVLIANGVNLLWSTGESTPSITVSTAGNYTVTQTVNGCTSASASATAAPIGSVASPSVSAVDNCGSSVLTASGSGTFNWSTGETGNSIVVTVGGNYTVTATVGSCSSAPASVVATPGSLPSAPVVTVVNNCGSSTITATGSSLTWSTGETGPTINVTTAGTFYVQQTVGSCVSPAAVATTAPLTIPTVTMTPLADVCINSAPFALTEGSPAGGTYSGPGVSANMFDPSVAGYGTHMIYYEYTAPNGCTNSNHTEITVGCATVSEEEADLVTIYPNPSNGFVVIEGINPEGYDAVNVYDEAGRLVFTNTISESKVNLNLETLATGTYSIRISGDSGVIVKKLQLIKD